MAPGGEGDLPVIDTSVPHIARVYDYWLGGKDNFAADREAAERALAARPGTRTDVRNNRAFLGRAVRYAARDEGIRQFLDIGTGIPSADNTHEVAQSVAAECRVVYVDNDPIVLTHARALLTSAAGPTAYIDADLRDTRKILETAERTLDFAQPIAVMLIAIMHCIPDEDDPREIVRTLLDAVPSGSFLALSHPAIDLEPEKAAAVAASLNQMMAQKITFRTHEEVSRFFDGLDPVEPGVVRIPQWRPDSQLRAATPTIMWGGVGRKP